MKETTYCVYLNWQAETAKIHERSCAYCKNRFGRRRAASSVTGEWLKFKTKEEFHDMARSNEDYKDFKISECLRCRP
ncbi:MAG: hypothetical protein HQK98_00925 [Nitrospirae bacterium]|nr:hypothetical protein [Nitrospirota bacterium]